MKAEEIEQLLFENGYIVLNSNISVINFYVKQEDSENRINIIACINSNMVPNISTEQLDNIAFQIERKYLLTGTHTVNFMYLIYSNNIEREKRYGAGKFNFWLIDIYSNRLIIFENQPEEFDNLRGKIENTLIRLANVEAYGQSNLNNFQKRTARSNNRWIRGKRFINVTILLIIINTIVFFVLESMGSTNDARFMLEHGALFHKKIFEEHQIYRLVTCMFMHYGFAHLFNNMFSLWFVGREVDRYYGSITYLAIYFISGISSSFGSALYNHYMDSVVVSAGASGAIYGILGALVVKVIENKRNSGNNIMKIAFVFLFLMMAGSKQDSVDNVAHFCGFVVGMVCAIIYHMVRSLKRRAD